MSVRIEIWQKKRAPASCPECGKVLKRDQVGENVTFSDLLKAHFTEPRLILQKRHSKWEIPCWYFFCPCKNWITDIFVKESYLLQKVKKDDTWAGGTIRVPFGKGV